MCVYTQRKNSGACALLLPLQFQLVNANFRCCVMTSITQVGLTNKNLQYQICSQLPQRLSSYETVQKSLENVF